MFWWIWSHSPTLLVIRRSWWVISTQGPIIRAIRYGESIGLMSQSSVRNTADIKKLPGIHGGFRGVIFYDKPGLTGIDIIICTERTRCLSRREP